MADLLPSSSDTTPAPDTEPKVIGVDSEDADDLLGALSSSTARQLLSTLHESPATPSELANDVDTSLQNAQYHIGKLEDADLIEVVDTRYSEKGREMNVYAPTDRPLVVFAGREEETTGLKAALSRLLGAVGVLGLASLAIQSRFGGGISPFGTGSSGDSGTAPSVAGSTPTPAPTTVEEDAGVELAEATKTVTEQAATVAADSVEYTTSAAGAETVAGLPPGLLFFAGGLLVIALATAWWYYSGR